MQILTTKMNPKEEIRTPTGQDVEIGQLCNEGLVFRGRYTGNNICEQS